MIAGASSAKQNIWNAKHDFQKDKLILLWAVPIDTPRTTEITDKLGLVYRWLQLN